MVHISLILALVKLFNRTLESGIFPDIWNISTISTLHQSGSLYDCNNYIRRTPFNKNVDIHFMYAFQAKACVCR